MVEVVVSRYDLRAERESERESVPRSPIGQAHACSGVPKVLQYHPPPIGPLTAPLFQKILLCLFTFTVL
jgi:hypothetical protein